MQSKNFYYFCYTKFNKYIVIMKKILLSAFALFCTFSFFGQSWVQQNTGFDVASRGIKQIQIVDANNVWALALNGVATASSPPIQEFTKTINGGTAWTAGVIDIGFPDYTINNISAVNANTAWVSGLFISNPAGQPSPGGIWKTTDGGASWVRQNETAFVGSGAFINGVHFWSATEGIAFGDPVAANKIECYRTVDGGATWTSVTTVSTMAPGEYNYNNGNVFVGNSIFLPTNKGKILRSLDKGLNWLKLNGPAGITDFGDAVTNGSIHFSDASNGVILGTVDSGATYKLYSTTNGGISWTTPATNYAGEYNRNLSYVPGTSTIVACGSLFNPPPAVSGSSYSMDNGATFTQIDTGSQRGTVSMLNGSTGWCGGFNAVSQTGVSTGGIFKFSGALSNESFSSANSFTASPNPAVDYIKISGVNAFNKIIIYDLLGKVIVAKTFNSISETSIDLGNVQAGAYILKVFCR